MKFDSLFFFYFLNALKNLEIFMQRRLIYERFALSQAAIKCYEFWIFTKLHHFLPLFIVHIFLRRVRTRARVRVRTREQEMCKFKALGKVIRLKNIHHVLSAHKHIHQSGRQRMYLQNTFHATYERNAIEFSIYFVNFSFNKILMKWKSMKIRIAI